MLRGDFVEGQQADAIEIAMEDVDPAVLSSALQWVYTDTVDPDTDPEFILLVLCLSNICICQL